MLAVLILIFFIIWDYHLLIDRPFLLFVTKCSRKTFNRQTILSVPKVVRGRKVCSSFLLLYNKLQQIQLLKNGTHLLSQFPWVRNLVTALLDPLLIFEQAEIKGSGRVSSHLVLLQSHSNCWLNSVPCSERTNALTAECHPLHRQFTARLFFFFQVVGEHVCCLELP